jgi:hypothetical protein
MHSASCRSSIYAHALGAAKHRCNNACTRIKPANRVIPAISKKEIAVKREHQRALPHVDARVDPQTAVARIPLKSFADDGCHEIGRIINQADPIVPRIRNEDMSAEVNRDL